MASNTLSRFARPRRGLVAARRGFVCLVFWAGAAAAPLAWAQMDLGRCRALADPVARLACYDALPVASPSSPATASPAVAAVAARPATVVTPATVPALATPAATASDVNAGAASFGIERAVRAETQEVVSRISGLFEGWGARTRLRLANGQVWQVVDGSSAALALNEPRVKVRRAVLGDFVFEVEGSNRTAKVKRVE